MSARSLALLAVTHIIAGVIGFAVGIFTLPILIAPPSPSEAEIETKASQATFTARFVRELEGSDAFHWGEGEVSIGHQFITFIGELAPGPDYKLYLSPAFVTTEDEFLPLKDSMVRVGDIKTFNNFVVEVEPGIDPAQFNTVVIWCETFGEFITAAKYR